MRLEFELLSAEGTGRIYVPEVTARGAAIKDTLKESKWSQENRVL